MKEEWKGLIYQSIDYSERIEISNTGKIRNTLNKKEYKLQKNKNGYYVVVVSLGGRNKKKNFKIHKGVAETFIPNLNNYPIINHKDGNKLNNNIENLEWCTYSYNTKEAYRNNLINVKSGIEIKNADFTIEDIKYIIANYKMGDKQNGCRALAKKFNVSHSVISNIINNKTYKKEIQEINI